MFFHRISSKNVALTENTNRSTFKVKVFSGSNTDKLFVDRKTCNMCVGELPILMREMNIEELTKLEKK